SGAMGITSEKLAQAETIVAESGADVWMTFVRESSNGGDPALPLILGSALVWQSALLVTKTGRRVAVVGNYDADSIKASGDWHEVIPYVQGIRQPLIELLDRLIPSASPQIAVNFSPNDDKADGLTHGMYLLLKEYLQGTRLE